MRTTVEFPFTTNLGDEIMVKSIVHVGRTSARGDDPCEVVSYTVKYPDSIDAHDLSDRDDMAIKEESIERATMWRC